MNVLFGILFENSAVSSALNTCPGLYPSPVTRLTNSSGYRFAAAVSADATSPTILMLCKDCLTLNFRCLKSSICTFNTTTIIKFSKMSEQFSLTEVEATNDLILSSDFFIDRTIDSLTWNEHNVDANDSPRRKRSSISIFTLGEIHSLTPLKNIPQIITMQEKAILENCAA
ncbi:hypothetical protein GQX74_011019 [Glossina fuscipes]|nr:hypothetical protein GQX74_011019 [Glossina fuscipes]